MRFRVSHRSNFARNKRKKVETIELDKESRKIAEPIKKLAEHHNSSLSARSDKRRLQSSTARHRGRQKTRESRLILGEFDFEASWEMIYLCECKRYTVDERRGNPVMIAWSTCTKARILLSFVIMHRSLYLRSMWKSKRMEFQLFCNSMLLICGI